MSSQAALFWNPRFAGEQYAYGSAPNDFLKAQASRLAAGSRVLSLGEGEGRNAIHLASLGHDVTAVDAAHTGLIKLLQRAARESLTITATLADLADYAIPPAHWHAIVSIFCHLPPALRRTVLRDCVRGLAPGGLFILEGYTPRQLGFGTGGPKDAALCRSTARGSGRQPAHRHGRRAAGGGAQTRPHRSLSGTQTTTPCQACPAGRVLSDNAYGNCA